MILFFIEFFNESFPINSNQFKVDDGCHMCFFIETGINDNVYLAHKHLCIYIANKHAMFVVR